MLHVNIPSMELDCLGKTEIFLEKLGPSLSASSWPRVSLSLSMYSYLVIVEMMKCVME